MGIIRDHAMLAKRQWVRALARGRARPAHGVDLLWSKRRSETFVYCFNWPRLGLKRPVHGGESACEAL